MSLDYPICVENVGISILSDTSPAAVEFQGRLWLFYNASDDEAIWYARFDGTGWEHARCCTTRRDRDKTLLPRRGTSPCPVVHNDRLHLFWSSRGADGILASVWDGKRFRGAEDVGALCGRQIGLGAHTSPAAVSFNGSIYLFWTGAANDALYYTTSRGPTDRDTDGDGGSVWSEARSCREHVRGVGVASGTSPALTVFRDALHVFYNGAGNDGTWYFTISPSDSGTGTGDETVWSDVTSIQQTVGGNGFLSATSPVALTMTSTDRLGLFWTGAGVNGVWYSLFNDGRWYAQQSVLKAISNHALHPNSSCAAVEFLSEPYIFWAGLEGGLWFTTRRIYDAVRDDREIFSILLGESFDEIHVALLHLADADTDAGSMLCRTAREQLALWPQRNDFCAADIYYDPQRRLENARFVTSFIAAMVGFGSPRGLVSAGMYHFASIVYLAVSKGYGIKMNFLELNKSLKAEIIGPGKDHGPSASLVKRDGEL